MDRNVGERWLNKQQGLQMAADSNARYLKWLLLTLLFIAFLLFRLWVCDFGYQLNFGGGNTGLEANESGNFTLVFGVTSPPVRHHTGGVFQPTFFGFGWKTSGGVAVFIPYWIPIAFCLLLAWKFDIRYSQLKWQLRGERCRNCLYDLSYRRRAKRFLIENPDASGTGMVIDPRRKRALLELFIFAAVVGVAALAAWIAGWGRDFLINKNLANYVTATPMQVTSSTIAISWIPGDYFHRDGFPSPSLGPLLGFGLSHTPSHAGDPAYYRLAVSFWFIVASSIAICVWTRRTYRRLQCLVEDRCPDCRVLKPREGSIRLSPVTTICPQCNYDLRAHKPGQKCPECGTQIPTFGWRRST